MKRALHLKLLLSILILFLSVGVCAQITQHPPEPMMNTTTTADGPRPCDDPDGTGDDTGFENEDGTPATPPPGLCMPINDYIIPLLLVGILLGVYKVQSMQKV